MTERIWDVPVGADKRYLVTCDGKPFAGFDSHSAAAAYVAAQKEKRNHNKRGPAVAAKATWGIKDRGRR